MGYIMADVKQKGLVIKKKQWVVLRRALCGVSALTATLGAATCGRLWT